MAWRAPTDDDLLSLLAQKEIDAFRKSAEFGTDPVPVQMANTVELVRGYIRAAGVRLGPEGTIPPALIVPAMCVLRFNYLTRQRLKVDEDRRKAYEDALATFKDVANGKLAVEPVEEPPADAASPHSPAFAPPAPRRLLD